MNRAAPWIACLAALLACETTDPASKDVTVASTTGGVAGGAGGTGGAEPALRASDYCESIVDSFCAFYLRCGRMAVPTVEACREAFLPSCNNKYEGRYVDLEAAGLLTLDAAGLAACAAHLDEVACHQQVFELTGPCAAIWRGTQPAGGACGLDVETFVCSPGTACTLGLDLCGTCETQVPLGGDCTGELTTCGAEAFCDMGSCRARVPNGDPCGPDDRCMVGAACSDGSCMGPSFAEVGGACAQGVRCPYLTACLAGTCQLTAAFGQACGDDASCNTDHCADTGECAWPQASGAPCDRNAACSSGICADGLCATLPSTCIAR